MGIRSYGIIKIVIGFVLMAPLLLNAQEPVINSISPTHATYGETITITGSNLTGIDRVFFGSVSVTGGDITVVSDNLIRAVVPEGVTHGPITVLNSSSNLIAQSSELFYISFGGTGTPSFASEFTIPTATDAATLNVFDICLCDINADGLNDVILTHENFDGSLANLAEFTYFLNASTPAATNFGTPNTVNLLPPFAEVDGFVSVKCRDLDNDGDNEVVFIVSEETLNEHIFIFDDITVTNPMPDRRLTLPRTSNGDVRDARGFSISDVDGDGLEDVLVANGTDNVIVIFRNAGGTNPFEVVEVAVEGPARTGSIDVADLNNDLLPDIVIVPFGTANENIYFLKNNSINGNISFLQQPPVTNPDTRRNVKIGDFNNDGLPDIAATALTTNTHRITILRNTSAPKGDIAFSFEENINIPTDFPWSLDLGDINGDGLLDIAVSDATPNNGEVYVIANNTTSSDISFESPLAVSINRNARNILIGDLNGDAKPDLAYSEGVNLNGNGGLGVLINTTCIEPVITPPDFTYCNGDPFTLAATNTPNAAYNWSILPGGAPTSTSANTATFTINSGSDESIEVEIVQEGCTTTEQIMVTFGGTASATPAIRVSGTRGTGTICEGDDIMLEPNITTAEDYFWTLPDGSTSTASEIVLNGVSASDAGEYTLTVRAGPNNCTSPPGRFNLPVEAFPPPVIFTNNSIVFCDNGANNPELEIEGITGGSYQWKLDGTDIRGATGTLLTANASGNYTAAAVNANGCVNTSGAITLQAVSEPVSMITGVTATCNQLATPFTASSTGETGFTLEHVWEVDSLTDMLATFTGPNFTYTFKTPSPFDYLLKLKTSYLSSEVAACTNEQNVIVRVSPPPAISFNVPDKTQKCSADALDVRVTNPGDTEISSYNWSTRNAANAAIISSDASSTNSVLLATPTGVDSAYATVNIITNIGCTVRDSILIRNLPITADISSPDFERILTKDSATLEDDISIKLEAVNLISDFSWEPAAQIDNPTAASISFFPQNPKSTVVLTGIDENGCRVSSRVVITLDNIRPKKTFSPNGDGNNDCWEILNIGDMGETLGCKVYIFDARGRNETPVIEQFDDENCVWDGTASGSPVPEGVYYFVLKCSDDTFSRSGSILLAR